MTAMGMLLLVLPPSYLILNASKKSLLPKNLYAPFSKVVGLWIWIGKNLLNLAESETK